ncbi:glycosyl hydrolase-related protein [Planctomycetota bacterium]
MKDKNAPRKKLRVRLFFLLWFGLYLALSVTCQAQERGSKWTVFLAQDKHLDYNWCGSTTEIELRMTALLDYFLGAAERNKVCWNLDGTLWDEVYHRHRGQAGRARLHGAIRNGRIGYAGNYAVLLWGIMDTETAIRACYGSVPIEKSTSVPARTALVMENPGMTWGIANILNSCGFDFLGRGIYRLRAESYHHLRDPYPLFWWEAPNGKRVLVHWDIYTDTKSWGGYAEGYNLAAMAGEKWDAFRIKSIGDRNNPEVLKKRKQFIQQTIERYEAYGDNYPISSILLLGTGWDNWTQTEDISAFIRKFNANSDGTVRIVDARYEDFFIAAEQEIRRKKLTIPSLKGSFGICWEEWAAHLAGPTAEFRKAQRLLRLAEASQTLKTMTAKTDDKNLRLLRHGVTELLKFAEHDFGGTDRQRAAMSAGARVSAVTQAMDIARTLAPESEVQPAPAANDFQAEDTTFSWRGGRVVFDPGRCGATSIVDAEKREWIPEGSKKALGEFVHTRYRSRAKPESVFPKTLDSSDELILRNLIRRRAERGVEINADFYRSGFHIESTWLFHTAKPWIDIKYRLRDGWTDAPQSVEFSFPLALENPRYRYDAPGAILVAGPKITGGDDLLGANPELYAGVTFAAASSGGRTVLLLTPDTLLLRFGSNAFGIPTQITSMPMMNLTGNDHQFGQGGRREWTFSYRIVLLDEDFNPVRAIQEAQQFATPPFLQAPGQAPVVSGLKELDIDFSGGPLLTFKTAEDNQRLILRFWNVQDRVSQGSLKLPMGWTRAEMCDALERPVKPLDIRESWIRFSAEPRGILTVALSKDP